MVSSSVKLILSKREITFKPDDAKDFARFHDGSQSDLTVTVINTTEKFASFQLELIVGELENNAEFEWYSTEPHICAKKPPGDRTQFNVTILKSPIPAYDISIPVKIKILSPEIENISTEETLILKVSPPEKSLWVDFPIREFTGYPGDRIKVPALIYNWSTNAKDLTLQIAVNSPKKKETLKSGDWFPQGEQQLLHLDAGNHQEVFFWLVPPKQTQTASCTYQLTLEGNDDQGNSKSTYAAIEIFPFGKIKVACPEYQQEAISTTSRFRRKAQCQGFFSLFFENKSNVEQQINLDVKTLNQNTYLKSIEPKTLTLETDHAGKMQLSLVSQRHWLIPKTVSVNVAPSISCPSSGETIESISINPSSQPLELKIKPVLPFWIQLLALAGILSIPCFWWLYTLPRARHIAPVNSVSILATGDTMFSGGRDQRLIHWKINRRTQLLLPDSRRLDFERIVSDNETQQTTSRSIGVIRHLPEDNNNQIAIGLEDGSVELWNINEASKIRTFSIGNDGSDRVFDIAFTKDTNFLFSGHGSGQVNRWPVKGNPEGKAKSYLYLAGTSISSIAVSEAEDSPDLLIAGGQYNRLAVWDYENKKGYNLAYKPHASSKISSLVTGPQSYITSVAAVDIDEDKGSILVTADSKGLLTIWSLDEIRRCAKLNSRGVHLRETKSRNADGLSYFSLRANEGILNINSCPGLIVDQWQASELNLPIRDTKISSSGCYIATAGDDGRVMLWSLTKENRVVSKEGLKVKEFKDAELNSVDLHHQANTNNNKNTIFIASDAPNNHIRLYRQELENHGCK